jgi:tRNA pseudouridine55 synthase
MNGEVFNGLLVVDKPEGVSSFGVVKYVRRLLGGKIKIGHGGTLDPFASGVLLLAIGKATRLVEYAMRMSKEYEFSMLLGGETDTLDCMGKLRFKDDVVPSSPKTKDIEVFLESDFCGNVLQVPPIYSALKVQGKRAYKEARANRDVFVKERLVYCEKIVLKGIEKGTDLLGRVVPKLIFQIKCGKGFYVRALARDIARRLGTYGYVDCLRRVEIGKFLVADAVKMVYRDCSLIMKDESLDFLRSRLLSARSMIEDMRLCFLSSEDIAKLCKGQEVMIEGDTLKMGCSSDVPCKYCDDVVAVVEDEELVAICSFDGKFLIPKKVLI